MTKAESQDICLRDARAQYFETNGFGADGGYGDAWVKLFQLGPVPVAFPNSPARVRAVRHHDLNHVVAGYATDFIGEAEISAWELASGCKGFVAAWILNGFAFFGGLFVDRRRVFRAFLRGRRTSNTYGTEFDDALLDRGLAEVRAELGLDEMQVENASAMDAIAFAATCAGSAMLVAVGLSPVLFVLWALSRLF